MIPTLLPLTALLLFAAPKDEIRVLPEGEVTSDARKTELVTLDTHHPWHHVADLGEWRARAEYLRRQVLVAAGLWPMPPRPPIEAVIHGAIDRGEYLVQKVFFESFPGFYVTGNLYLPTAPSDGPRPAVLSPHGHWTDGRFFRRSDDDVRRELEQGWESREENARYPLQARLATLARLGCIVFHYDMVGYADSRQLVHGEGFGDLEAELWSQSPFGLQTFDSIRALDFLSGLPGIDPARIGVTGASGGGTQTFILGAIDPRPAAAFPAVMVSTGMQGGCRCENASHLRIDTGNVELAALFAPRPLMMTGANDWTLHIEEDGLPELKTLWSLYGVPWCVQAACYPQYEHNYNETSRERMYAWFDTHLGLGAELPIRDAPLDPIAPAELSVFDEAHPRPANAVDAKGLREVWRGIAEEQLASLVPHDEASLEEFRRVVGGALEVGLHTRLPEPREVVAKTVGSDVFGASELVKLRLARRGSGEDVPAILMKPDEWSGVVVVASAGDGKRSLLPGPWSEVCLKGRCALLAVDPLLTGEHLDERGEPKRLPRDERRHAGYPGYTFGYDRPLLAWRVHDLLTAVAFARGLEGVKSVRLLGVDGAGTWALLARALARDAIDVAVVDWSERLDAPESLDDPDLLPGALRFGGLDAFAALSAPEPLYLFEVDEVPPILDAAYRAAGARSALWGGRSDCLEEDSSPPFDALLAGPASGD